MALPPGMTRASKPFTRTAHRSSTSTVDDRPSTGPSWATTRPFRVITNCSPDRASSKYSERCWRSSRAGTDELVTMQLVYTYGVGVYTQLSARIDPNWPPPPTIQPDPAECERLRPQTKTKTGVGPPAGPPENSRVTIVSYIDARTGVGPQGTPPKETAPIPPYALERNEDWAWVPTNAPKRSGSPSSRVASQCGRPIALFPSPTFAVVMQPAKRSQIAGIEGEVWSLLPRDDVVYVQSLGRTTHHTATVPFADRGTSPLPLARVVERVGHTAASVGSGTPTPVEMAAARYALRCLVAVAVSMQRRHR